MLKTAVHFFTIFSALIFLNACSRGNDGAGTTGTVVTQTASNAVIRALTEAKASVPDFNLDRTKASAEETNKALSLPSQIQKALKGLKTRISKIDPLPSSKVTRLTLNCESGNIVILGDDNKTPSDLRDDSSIIQYNECTNTENFRTVLTRGQVFKSRETIIETDYLVRTTNPLNGSFAEILRNGTSQYILTEENIFECDGAPAFKQIQIKSNAILDIKSDRNGNGTLEIDQQRKFTNWDLLVSEDFQEGPDCKVTGSHFILNGGVSETDLIESNLDFSVGFKNFEMDLISERSTLTGFNLPPVGLRVHFSGSAAIKGPCSLGRFTIATPADDGLFFPTNARCATTGRFIVSTTEGEHAVIARPGGSVRIDQNNDGSIDEEFSSCLGAKLC